MFTLDLYGSLHNGGDGSVYIDWSSTEELAQYDQDNLDLGWGESCTEHLSLESESPISISSVSFKVMTPEGYLASILLSGEGNSSEFLNKFFPDGQPCFRVEVLPATDDGEYFYHDVYVEEKRVMRSFRHKSCSVEATQTLLSKRA
jgi:hypothetical protein